MKTPLEKLWADKFQPGSKVIAPNKSGQLHTGEYTGYSSITGLHHVSFYNGETRGFKDLKEIKLDQ